MRIIDITQCVRRLDFSPQKPVSSHLPAHAVMGDGTAFLLSGFERKDGNAVLLETKPSDALAALYPNATTPEIARMVQLVRESFGDLESENLLRNFGHRPTQDSMATWLMIARSPRSFQDWASQKAVSFRELNFLDLLKEDLAAPILDKIGNSRIGKSQGLVLLELWFELCSMGVAVPDLNLEKTDHCIKELLGLRNPLATKRDLEAQAHLKTLPWPAHMQAKWIRQGDLAGVEVRFNLFSKKDLEKHLQGLDKVQKSSLEKLWT